MFMGGIPTINEKLVVYDIATYPMYLQNGHLLQGLVNVQIKHHPTIGDIISNKYLKVMSKIPKRGHLPTPVLITSYPPGVGTDRSILVSHQPHDRSDERP